MKMERAAVISQEEVYDNTFLMWLSCPPVAKGAQPGRFLMIRCGDAYDPLLPRPMSFHRFRQTEGERQFAILYDVRGRGTALLSERNASDALPIFGPLGRGYSISPNAQNLLLVAGGLGIAALIALADEAITAGQSVTLLQGARSARHLYPPELLPNDVESVSSTDDGSTGHRGYVTDLMPEYLPWADQIFACGPTPMFASMAKVVREARSRKPVQALLEERMGCGTGICYGCAVFTRRGVRLVCKDGPRFELRSVFA
jgi:dihydroorotate dehydrogenase electron transfer subunit